MTPAAAAAADDEDDDEGPPNVGGTRAEERRALVVLVVVGEGVDPVGDCLLLSSRSFISFSTLACGTSRRAREIGASQGITFIITWAERIRAA